MSAVFFRPVVTYPARCSAPAFFARPAVPSSNDFVPLFSLFDESLAQLERAQRQSRPQFKRPFNPKFDVKENQEAYSLEGELPGFDAKDISIEFLDDGHTLQIKGKTVKETRKQPESQDKAVEASEAPKAVEQAPTATESEASSVRSHQPTVEDEVEQPANASAVMEQPQQQQETPTPAEQQVEKPQEKQADTKHWISERYTGSFTRSFKFPSKVDQDAVKASLKDGILAITLPFARKPESRRIQIE